MPQDGAQSAPDVQEVDPKALKQAMKSRLRRRDELDQEELAQFIRDDLGLEPGPDLERFIVDHRADIEARLAALPSARETTPPMKLSDARQYVGKPIVADDCADDGPHARHVGDDIDGEQAALEVERADSLVTLVSKREKDPETGDIGLTNEHAEEVIDALTPDDRSSQERTDLEKSHRSKFTAVADGNEWRDEAASTGKKAAKSEKALLKKLNAREAEIYKKWNPHSKGPASDGVKLDPKTTDVSDALARLQAKNDLRAKREVSNYKPVQFKPHRKKSVIADANKFLKLAA
jgi:hypothetical protein